MGNRLLNLQKLLKEKELDGFIVTNPTNIFYLCGFRGFSETERESILVFRSFVPQSGAQDDTGWTLIAPRLYQKEALFLASKDLKVFITPERYLMFQKAKKLLAHPRGEHSRGKAHPGGVLRVGFEEDDLKYGEYEDLRKFSTSSNNKSVLAPFGNLIENLRIIKTEEEIAKIEKAQIISQKAFEKIIKTLKVGQTEEEIADRLAKIIKDIGGQGLSFKSIVASGPNSGIPHHRTNQRRIANGEPLLFDFGATFDNYHADLSRTVFIGRAKDQQTNIYRHVLTAQRQALTKIRHGVKLAEAYNFANNHFKKHSLDQYFLHGLGHGIGLDVHETPYLRQSSIDDRLLTNEMVFSVEPGLYFPWGGVRIEDLAVIKNGKTKVLGKTVNEIIEI